MAEKEFRRIDREVENEMLADPVKRKRPIRGCIEISGCCM